MPRTNSRAMDCLPANQTARSATHTHAPASNLSSSTRTSKNLANIVQIAPARIRSQASKKRVPDRDTTLIDAVPATSSRDCTMLSGRSPATIPHGEVVVISDSTSGSEESHTIEGESNSWTGGDTPSEMIAGRPDDAAANALTKADRERLWKCAMEADLKGDVAASEMFYRLLKLATVQPAINVSANPPPIVEAPALMTPVPGKAVGKVPAMQCSSPTLQKGKDDNRKKETDDSIPEEGRPLFVKGSVTSHMDLGFSAFFEKNIRELKGPLPLTIFDRQWQLEATQTCHVHKRPRLNQMQRYAGHSYPNEWSQSYGAWVKNYRNFHAALRDVYGFSDFASRLLQHKERVEELSSTYGFLPAFRYDLLVRADTFSSRSHSPPNIHSLPDISQFRKDLWERSYNLSQKLDELRFEDNPYRRGGVRSSWDPLTGTRINKPACKKKESRRSNMIPDLYPDPNLHPAPNQIPFEAGQSSITFCRQVT